MQVRHENCIVPKGIQFLDNECLRKLLLVHHSDKIKNGILYITRTALCYFASEVGLGILDTQVFKVSSRLTIEKKTFATILASLPIPLLGIWGITTIPVVLSIVTFLSGTNSIYFFYANLASYLLRQKLLLVL